MKPERLDRTTIYESEWVNLYRDRVRLSTGVILPEYHVLDFPKECVATVVENEDGELLFIGSYRYPIDSLHWEIPAGRIEDDETIEEAAQRETLEETGYDSTDHRHFYTYYPSNGISNQTFHIVACRATEKVGEFDANEVSETKWLSKAQALEMIRDGSMKDGYTLTALLLHFSDDI